MENIKDKAKKGVKWASYQQIVNQSLNLSTLFILTILLLPEDFGLQTTVAIVISFVAVFQDFGLKSVIIKSGPIEKKSLNSYFWFGCFLGIVAYLILVIFGQYILKAIINEDTDLNLVTVILQVQAITILFSNLNIVQESLILKELKFKEKFIIDSIAYSVSSILAVTLAELGMGVWSLVHRQIVLSLFLLIGSTIATRWVPSFSFSMSHIRKEAGFSSNLSLAMITNYLSRNIDYLLIGKFLGTNMLGQYTVAYKIMLLPLKNLSAVISQILFPTLAKFKSDENQLGQIYIKTIGVIASISFPIMAIVCGLAEPMSDLFFADKYPELAFLLTILSWVGAAQSLTSPVGMLYVLKNKTNILLYYSFITPIIVGLSTYIGIRWGIKGVAICYAISWMIIMFPLSNIIPFRYYNINFIEFHKGLWPQFSCSILTAATLLVVNLFYKIPNIAILVLLGGIGAAVYYIAMNHIFKINVIEDTVFKIFPNLKHK